MLPSRRIGVAVSILILAIFPFLVLFLAPVGKAATGEYSWPVAGSIIRGFEKPTGPYGEGGHEGVDIAAEPGKEVRSAKEGKVAWVGELPRGRFVSISHPGGVRTTYLDLESISVSAGDRVARGQVIGTVSGKRDSSSTRSHLHFDTYLNGTPVDPCLIFRGLDAGSFVRLCPVKRGGSSSSGDHAATDDPADPVPAQPSRTGRTPATPGHSSRGLIGFVSKCFSSAWHGICTLAGWVGDGCQEAWSSGIYPVLRGTGRAVAGSARWAWGNRYVQAVAAGLAAAILVVIGVIIAFILLPISAVVAVIAAVAGALACIGMAIYFAATHGASFSFGTCFFKSLSVGAIVATAVVSWGMLSTTVEAGWAGAGLSGTCWAAFTNGLFSMIFDTGINYLFTGHISLKSMLVAFVIGAISGGFGKVLRGGMMSERLARVYSVAEVELEAGTMSLSQTAVLIVNQVTVKIEVFLVTCKELALTFGGKIAYITFSGSLTAGLNIATCLATHRPITLSGVFASFLAGAAMGGLALSFGGQGLSGLLSRFRVFQQGLGISFRKFLAKVINKSISKGLKNGFETLFKKALKEEEESR